MNTLEERLILYGTYLLFVSSILHFVGEGAVQCPPVLMCKDERETNATRRQEATSNTAMRKELNVYIYIV